jgi:hypothetical protein
MSFSSRLLILLGAVFASAVCIYLAVQFAALSLPFLLSSPYRGTLSPVTIFLFALGGLLRARKRRRALHPS